MCIICDMGRGETDQEYHANTMTAIDYLHAFGGAQSEMKKSLEAMKRIAEITGDKQYDRRRKAMKRALREWNKTEHIK